MTVKERLIEYIKYKKISIREFCRTIGVSESYVTSMRSSLQPDKITHIVEHFPDLSTTWLLTGEGEMIRQNQYLSGEERQTIINAGADVFKDKLIEMFVNGEIYSASVVQEKDKLIWNLYQRITMLEDEINHRDDEITALKKQCGQTE